MRNTQRLGRISRSKKHPRPTLRSGRASRTNSNTSHPIPVRVIEADSVRAISRPLASTKGPARLDQYRAGARNEEGFEVIAAVDDEIRGIVARNWPHLLDKL